jgi:hypothetical protein
VIRKALFAHRQMYNCSCLVTVLGVCGSALVVLVVLQAAAHYTPVDTLWAYDEKNVKTLRDQSRISRLGRKDVRRCWPQ